MHPRAGCSSGSRSSKSPLKAPQSELPCAPVDAQGVGSVGRDYFKLLPSIHTTPDTGSPARAVPARGETGGLFTWRKSSWFREFCARGKGRIIILILLPVCWMTPDYVYFENSSSNPYLIRRIEELNKTATGNVEAKVVCFYRRRDISNTLIMLADKHAKEIEEESETTIEADLTDKQKHQLKHRELFLSRQYESLPATHIRGKCSVALLNETESVLSYLDKEDTFFYSLVYDPSVKTLLADKGEIRVGPRYQADIPEMLLEGESDEREQSKLEVKVWDPNSPLTDRQIDQFLVVARAVGTFARALDCSSSVRQPSLHMSAAAASRDITLFHAMDTLYRHSYDLSSAISVLVPLGGPVLCRDEMEEWSASEASLFEEALEKYGKDFNDIRQDFLPWKSLTSIIEYYYMWKTTDRYVQQKRLKAAEAESKLKQVYIPTYSKPNPNQISASNGKPGAVNGAVGTTFQPQNPLVGRACESCYATQSHQWYSWGPPNMQCRLCATCWLYWKKYGGLKMPTQSEEEKLSPSPTTEDPRVRSHMSRQAMQGMPVRNTGSPKSAVKTRQAFFLHTTYFTKFARQVCKNTLRLRQAARRPFVPINYAAIRAEYADRHAELSGSPLKSKSTRKPLACIIGYLEPEEESCFQKSFTPETCCMLYLLQITFKFRKTLS
ncbi:metastasis-associated protein MTA3 isoform X3 [Callorhinus ursinus]|uniref:metastasis-associated protein MTA3 isoform X3 n=1 Tax=Callorhinus ursinus TaxID=34884 RepID=UPI003CCFF7E2